MAIDTTVGGANADSYASVAELDAYVAQRSPAPAWYATATTAQKEAALVTAANLLDAHFQWTGVAVDAVQALTWPRSGMLTRNGFAIATTAIPAALKKAQMEYAAQVGAANLLADNDALKQGVTEVKAGSVGVKFRSTDISTEEGGDVALQLQTPALMWAHKNVPDEVRALLVPSWYTTTLIKKTSFLEAIG